MTTLEDLLVLYKMALQYQLDFEKKWLKEQIEERLANTKISGKILSFDESLNSELKNEKNVA